MPKKHEKENIFTAHTKFPLVARAGQKIFLHWPFLIFSFCKKAALTVFTGLEGQGKTFVPCAKD